MNEIMYAEVKVISKQPRAAPDTTFNPIFFPWVKVVLTIRVIINPGLNAKLT